jgi:uncharacterized cupin superfamily protein
MRKINVDKMKEESSLRGSEYGTLGKDVSVALGRKPQSNDVLERHPFDVEIVRIPVGRKNTLFHAHGAQWEFYHVLEGRGKARHAKGVTRIEKGDAFLFKPFEPHQIINDGDDDMVIYLIATNPFNESIYLPDEEKWIVKSPKIAKVRFDTEQIFSAKPAKQKTPRKAKRS